MRILIVGGCGFIGSHLAERFIKEGNDVFVIDDLSSGREENITVKYVLYHLCAADERCEEVFRLHNLDVVIYAAAIEAKKTDGMMNILAFSAQYEVKKFLFLSPEKAVNGQIQYGLTEECCFLYDKRSVLDVVVVRLSEVYGPRQSGGVVAPYVRDALVKKEVVIEENRVADFLYVEDAVDAVFRLAERDYQGGVINVSSNVGYDLPQLCQCLAEIVPFSLKAYADHLVLDQQGGVDHARCEDELGWRCKYTLAEGLKKTCDWYKTHLASVGEAKGERKRDRAFWRPYAENILLFGVMVVVMISRNHHPINDIGMDYHFIYIAVMGLLYGKSQALPAVFLSSVLLMSSFIAKGADFVAILYQVQHMVHFAAYLFFGVLVGYVTDNKDRAYHDLTVEMSNTKERFHFLERMYLDNVAIKERLYKQIVNSEDSIGRTYKIVKKLDTIEVENVFTEATEVAAELMASRNASIYVLNKHRNYLRLKTMIGMQIDEIPKSIKVDQHAYLKEMMEDKQVFVNKLLTPGLPDMAAPVVYNNEVIAVIQIHRLQFEDLHLNKQNLLKITAMLIAGALAKAYQYEESIQDKKYIADTRILTPKEFGKIESQLRQRKENNQNEAFALLLKVGARDDDYVGINDLLSPLIRDEDFLGIKDDGCVYLLLVNITDEVVDKVQRRIQNAGLTAEVVRDEGMDD